MKPLAICQPGPGAKSRSDWNALDHRRIRFMDVLPILVVHALCLGVLWTGWSWPDVIVAVGLYLLRMFTITAFYHRYFSHRTFKTHRIVQFVAACVGSTAAQRGPLWWASHHREHHRHSDHEPDPHSPWWRGVLWSHTAWFLTEKGQATNWRAIPDWARFRELLWVERHHMYGPIALSAVLAGVGWWLSSWQPSLGTSAAQMVVWGFGVSTTALYHATFTINSLAHTMGSRRFNTNDDSRNNWFLALLTLGEGWHNNHHFNPGSVRQGFYWWEFDPAYWLLRVMSWLGLVWELRAVPSWVYERAESQERSGARGDS